MRIINKNLLKNNNSKKIKKNTIFNNKGYILLTTSIIIFVVSTILSSLSAGFIFYNNLYHSSLKEDDSFKESEVNNLKKDVINFTYANYFDLLYMLKDGSTSKIEEITKDEDNNTETKEEYFVLDLLKDINYDYKFTNDEIEKYFDLSGYNKEEDSEEYESQIVYLIDQASSKIYDKSRASSEDASKKLLDPVIDEKRIGSYKVDQYFNDLNEDISISLYTKKLSFNMNFTSLSLSSKENRIYYAYDNIGVAYLAHLFDFSIEIKNDSYRLTLNFTNYSINKEPDEAKKYPFEYMKNPNYNEASEGENESPTIEEGEEAINPDEGSEEEVTSYNQIIKLDLTIDSTLEKIN